MGECEHPEDCIEWGDDDERGECTLCGATCDWHWTNAIVGEWHDDDGDYRCQEGQVREILEWHSPDCEVDGGGAV